MTPLVSVVIPTYNQPALLSETLKSVFAQTMRDFEIIVVNDGSTDNTSEVLKGFGNKIRVISQDNMGIGAARNRGIAESRGKYVATLDHDDLWMPEKLEVQTAYYERHAECAMVTVPYSISTDPDHPAFDFERYASTDGIVQHPLREYAGGQTLIGSSTLMFDRERAFGLGYVTARLCTEDQAFHIGLAGRGPLGVAGDRVLMVYRLHEGNHSKSALYHFNGARLLRQMLREGVFNGLGEQKKDAEILISHVARTATIGQLRGGYRGRALRLYLAEFWPQLFGGRGRFLLMTPLLICMPRAWQERVIRRA